MEAYGVIYLLINCTNDKEYVGQTIRSLEVRFKQHAKADTHIGRAIRAHGADMFIITTLKICYDKEELDAWEKHFIKYRDTMAPNGYNLTEGGDGGKPCAELSAKKSANMSGEKHPFFGKHHTAESKAKMAIAHKGKTPAPETCSKKSVANRSESHFKNLLSEMDAHNLSYNALGQLLGLNQVSVSERMLGRIKFSESGVAKLVEIFKKPAEYLMARDDGLPTILSKNHKTPYKNLAKEMATRKISYSKLANLLGLARKTVFLKMCGDKYNFNANEKAQIAEILGKSVEYLFQRDE